MIQLPFDSLLISSSNDQVFVHRDAADPNPVVIAAPDLLGEDVAWRSDLPLRFDAETFTLVVAGAAFGGSWRRWDDAGNLLATLRHAARFAAPNASLDQAVIARRELKVEVENMRRVLQDVHLRTRLAAMLGVMPGALSGYAGGAEIVVRSGTSVTIRGVMFGHEVRYALEFEHVTLQVGRRNPVNVRKVEDITGEIERAEHAGGRDEPRNLNWTA